MAAQVNRAHVIVAIESGRDKIKPVRVRCTAVHAQHRWFSSGAVILIVQSQAGNFDKVIGVGCGYERSEAICLC